MDPAADEELIDAAVYYETQKAGLGADFLRAIRERLAALRTDSMESSRPPGVSPELPVRRVFVRRFPYVIVFVETFDEVRVIAIAHSHRKPGYWAKRL
ncbi:type II toxin-antitoxin system RelE/ParE family toxin [Pendulispora albinea]|uniref:Type II toxin-antitoxin system RelE/ParE family toxin n=1 Tax=Pendulispora albinea TaxID=2741071 RepID=A0ABZ2M9T0_9BACT